MKTVKIGLLIPNSNFIPIINKGIFSGLDMALKEHDDLTYEICVEAGGYNADKKTVKEKLNELAIKKEMDIVVAPLNYALLHSVTDLFASQEIPLIVNTLGEDVWFDESKSPYVFSNSFHLWQACWLLGQWTGSHFGKNGSTIVALHDSGYGMLLAFAIGVEAEGGKVIHPAVTHLKTRTDDCSAEIGSIAAKKPDFIAAFYSGKEAVSFLKDYKEKGLLGKIPLVGLPFLTEPEIIEQIGEDALGIQSAYCWQDEMANFANENFIKKIESATGRKAHCYSLMAYESGHLIAKAVKEAGDAKVLGKKLAEVLPHISYDGPRGKISFNKETTETITKQYLVESAKRANNKFYHKTIQELEIPKLLDEHYTLGCKNLQKQGWLNPYLCA